MPPFQPAVQPDRAARDDDLCCVFHEHSLLVLPDGQAARLPDRAALRVLGVSPRASLFLGTLDGIACYAATTDFHDALAPAELLSLRALFGRLDDDSFALAGRAYQLLQWDRTHRFCGRCGASTERLEHERSRRCPACGQAHYPRLAPAVMVLIRRGRELLLARSPHFPPEMFSALAGFVEPGESLEDTVAREVREEVGVEVTGLRYFGSQPWPFPHSLMIAFVADYAGGDIVPQAGEIEAAGWFDVAALPRLPHPVSIARRLIDEVADAIRISAD